MPQFAKSKKQLMNICVHLAERATIPQIKAQLEFINTIVTEEFWQDSDILNFEKVRLELRELIKFIVDEGSGERFIPTSRIKLPLLTRVRFFHLPMTSKHIE